MRQLIQIVQAHMDEYGVSEAEVARRIGATPQTVNSWRNGEMKQLPRQHYLSALAELTRTAYTTVLAAALNDTGYLAEPIGADPNYTALIVSLAVDADDLELAATEVHIGEARETVAAIRNLVSEVNAVADAIHAVASEVVGGDDLRLRQLKREIRHYRREQADPRRLDISFGADRRHDPTAETSTPPVPPRQ